MCLPMPVLGQLQTLKFISFLIQKPSYICEMVAPSLRHIYLFLMNCKKHLMAHECSFYTGSSTTLSAALLLTCMLDIHSFQNITGE